MKIAVVLFPGSNCDHDACFALSHNLGVQTELVWHQDRSLSQFDAVIIPGGFSYGDYLRCGAIAKFSPVMEAVTRFAREGGPVLGICNGFQVLTEAGLLPGALVRNAELRYLCKTVPVEVVTTNSVFTSAASPKQVLQLPIGHGEGCYVADETTLAELTGEDRIILNYQGHVNGSLRDIAGIVNKQRNVLGMMPHPERAADPLMGNTDGLVILRSLVSSLLPALSRS